MKEKILKILRIHYGWSNVNTITPTGEKLVTDVLDIISKIDRYGDNGEDLIKDSFTLIPTPLSKITNESRQVGICNNCHSSVIRKGKFWFFGIGKKECINEYCVRLTKAYKHLYNCPMPPKKKF